MIIGIGTDIVKKERIKDILEKHGERFIDRILTYEERDYYAAKKLDDAKIDYLAKRFAAKEAIAKALGVGIGEVFGFADATIFNHHSGKPDVALSEKGDKLLKSLSNNKGGKVHLSLSDEQDVAIAYVVIEAHK